jgi:hypothetical protein
METISAQSINNILLKHQDAAAREIAAVAFSVLTITPATTSALEAPKAVKAVKAAKTAKARKPAKAKKLVKGGGKGSGVKRDPKVLEALVEKLFDYIKSNPGQRIEAISAGLGIPSKELNLPIKKLFKEGSISKKGAKRATSYSTKP